MTKLRSAKAGQQSLLVMYPRINVLYLRDAPRSTVTAVDTTAQVSKMYTAV